MANQNLSDQNINPTNPKKKKNRKWIPIVIGVLASCCILTVIIGVISQGGSNKATTTTPSAVVAKSADQSKPEATKSESEPTAEDKATEPPAATEAPAPTETAAPAIKDFYKVGERAEESGIAITVLNVQKVNKISILTADAGNTYLDVEVLIENINRDDATPYNGLYFKVKDDSAAEYTTAMMSIEPSLKTGDLVKGDKARGHVAFEVAESAKGFVLSYEPMVIFGGYKTIRVNLDEKADTPVEVGTLTIGENQTGQRFESAGVAITVLNAKTVPSLSGLTPDKGMVYLDLEVLIENDSREETTPYNPLYFKVKDASYLEFSTAMLSLEPSLKSGDMVKGDKVRGHVAFEVPADGKKFVVSYEPLVIFGGYKVIAINVILP